MKSTNIFIEKFNQWMDSFIEHTPNIVLALIVFILGIFVAQKINKLTIYLLSKRKIKLSAKIMIGNLTSIIVIFIFFFISLNILQLDQMLKTILAGAGVVTLAIGLALQGTLSNTFSGITLSFIKDIKIGDLITTNGYTGYIEEINLRAVTIRQNDNNYVKIPNKMILENPFVNFASTEISTVILECGVAYDSDLEFVRDLVIATVQKKVAKLIDVNSVYFFYSEFADSSINFKVGFNCIAKTVMEINLIKSDSIIAIKKEFDANGIEIPFPIRTLEFPADFPIKN